MNSFWKNRNTIAGIIFGIVFFSIGFFTVSDYGLNLDEVMHYWRGHRYLHYFLTGNRSYDDIASGARRSVFQNITFASKYTFENDSGHPVVNDVLAAGFNAVFYQALGLLPDLESHHIFILLVSSIAVGAVVYFASSLYGLFAGIIAGLSMGLYPLFLGESHFNIKDPVETSFYTLTLIAFYFGITKANYRWILVSAVSAGLALGTKFNIFFAIPTVGIWLFFARKEFAVFLRKIDKKIIFSLLSYPFIVFGIFFVSWPFLWINPVKNALSTFTYYKDIGYGITYQADKYRFIGGINTYGLQWISFTTPIIILILTAVGIWYVGKRGLLERYKTSLFIFFWFVIPIARVTVPNTGIYGGVRQIMEYIPAMALLAGIGAHFLVSQIRKSRLVLWVKIILLILFIPIGMKLISLHPNENAYMNPIIGGVSGARARNLDFWGHTFGNVYRQGIFWLNEHAEKNSTLALGGMFEDVILREWLRPDIAYSNDFRSGFDRKGEYVMEMTSDKAILPHLFYLTYVKNFLIPVYQVMVDGVPILTIWKNDREHTKPEYLQKKEIEVVVDEKYIIQRPYSLTIKLNEVTLLTGITIEFKDRSCTFTKTGYFRTYDGTKEVTHSEDLATVLFFPKFNPLATPGELSFLFGADVTEEILVAFETDNTCLQHPGRVTIRKLVL